MTSRALALAAILSGLSLGACTAGSETAGVSFNAICAITDDCKFAAECDTQYIGVMVFDASLASQLWLPIQVNNALPNNADLSVGRLNTNDAHLTSFEITYQNFGLASATVPVSYTIPASGKQTVGVYVVPPQGALVAAPAVSPQQSIAYITGKGFYEDGSSFETGVFPVPFTYCDGCIDYGLVCAAGETVVAACPPGSLGSLPATTACVAP